MTTQTTQTLNEGLYGVRDYLAQVAPAPAIAAIQADLEELQAAGTAANALKTGEKAPDFTLPNVKEEDVTLADLLEKGQVVLVFYRGEWCPYCNLTLKTYQGALAQFEAHNARLVAVSPQTPDHSLSVAQKNELSFEVLSDQGNRVARQYGLVFQVGSDLRPHLSGLGADVPTFNGEDSWELPIPGIYVIGQDGVVKSAFVDPDFRNRPEVSQIIAALAS